jgi:hypothetical protein
MRGRLPGGLLAMPAAALLVHQLRYTLAYGSHANGQLIAQGHTYLHSLVPWLVLTLAVGLSAFVRRAAHALRTGETGTFSRRSAAILWAATSGGLVVIYAVQESLEELFASGHPKGLAGIFGHGGWWAVPVAAFVALLIVAFLRLGRSLVRVAGALARRRVVLPAVVRTLQTTVVLVPARRLALAAAGRAPPQ